MNEGQQRRDPGAAPPPGQGAIIDRRGLLGAAALAMPAAALAMDARGSTYRRIATEEAFATPEWFAATDAVPLTSPESNEARMLRGIEAIPQIRRGLLDFDHRLEVMDQCRVDMHLLSLTTPGVQSLDRETAVGMARRSNDFLAEAIRRHPTRFAGLAAVAPQDPQAAASEIDRAMTQLGLNGVLINSYTDGEYLDHPKFEPILAALVRHRAPLYLHPRAPAPAMVGPYVDHGLLGAIWGFAADTGLHAMRMIMAGVFDRHPELNVVLGHMGEAIPYWFWRIDNMAAKARSQAAASGRWWGPARPPSDYFRSNFHITTSGVNSHANLRFAIELPGAERIMFAIDYPFEDSAQSVAFLDTAPISEADRRKIAYANAERVFKISAS